jgi:hypothetical protein
VGLYFARVSVNGVFSQFDFPLFQLLPCLVLLLLDYSSFDLILFQFPLVALSCHLIYFLSNFPSKLCILRYVHIHHHLAPPLKCQSCLLALLGSVLLFFQLHLSLQNCMLLSLVTFMIFLLYIVDHVSLFACLVNLLEHSAFKPFKLLHSVVD